MRRSYQKRPHETPWIFYTAMVTTKVLDSIPRTTVQQVLEALSAIAALGGKATFEQVRQSLLQRSGRRAPPSRDALWTVARDVLGDLNRLRFISAGILPRKRSEVDRLRNSPCEITDRGTALALTFAENRGQAFDDLLLAWVNEHPYFRAFITRLLRGPLHVPDITSVRQLGPEGSPVRDDASLADRIAKSCAERLDSVEFPARRRVILIRGIQERAAQLRDSKTLAALDAERWIEAVEDLIVLPAFLAAEELPFDHVTFQHLLRATQDFYAASWTSSYPGFLGRVIFSTWSFSPDVNDVGAIATSVQHHGVAFAAERFPSALEAAYRRLAGSSSGYVDAYAARAIVCLNLGIQPRVFSRCLEQLIAAGTKGGFSIYTELPFVAPPRGEDYVRVATGRVGRLKLAFEQEG